MERPCAVRDKEGIMTNHEITLSSTSFTVEGDPDTIIQLHQPECNCGWSGSFYARKLHAYEEGYGHKR